MGKCKEVASGCGPCEERPLRLCFSLLGTLLLFLTLQPTISAQEGPYFITYTHQMEEPGSLEVTLKPVVGVPKHAPWFAGYATEFEYGVRGWWTTELYLDAQSTRNDTTLFTGFRWENRFRLLMREHWVNPVFYLEFEDINGADKTLLEVVNHDGEDDLAGRNAEARAEKQRELEGKLILSSNFRGWNVAENFIAERNLANAPWEFGYAWGVSRPLALAASPRACSFCRENFRAGVEMYGGMGTWNDFGLAQTSHYVGPVIAWDLPGGVTLGLSPSFGLTASSTRALFRFSVSREMPGFGRSVSRMFR